MHDSVIEALDNLGIETVKRGLESEYHKLAQGYYAILKDREHNTTWGHIPELVKDLTNLNNEILDITGALYAIDPLWDKLPF